MGPHAYQAYPEGPEPLHLAGVSSRESVDGTGSVHTRTIDQASSWWNPLNRTTALVKEDVSGFPSVIVIASWQSSRLTKWPRDSASSRECETLT